MSLTGVFSSFDGLGGSGDWLGNSTEHVAAAHLKKLRDFQRMAASGAFARNQYVGGDWNAGVDASSAGDVDVLRAVPFVIDNTSSYLSGSSGLVVQIRYYVRVSNAGITVTPKIVYGTALTNLTNAATISGQAACSATNSDYSGTDQIQTVAFTLPAGVKMFKPRFTIGGTPAAGYQAWVFTVLDCYIS